MLVVNGKNLRKKNKKGIDIREREVNKMLRTLDYGNVPIVECNVIRLPFDTYTVSIEDSDGNWYDIYALEDGGWVAVLDESLDE